ncbi:MAG: DNA primase, partial [Pseudomonadota bacterium]
MASSIAKFIQAAQERITLSSLFSGKLKLTKRGREYVALCPFHQETTPSFSIIDDKNFYYCFGCGAHGTAYNFFTDYLGLDAKAALEELSRHSGIKLPEFSNMDDTNTKREQLLYNINLAAARWYRQQLSEQGQEAINHLSKRQLQHHSWQKFGLGYAPPKRGLLMAHLKSLNITESDIVSSGLAYAKDNGGYGERFINRLMFPIINQEGNIVGFGGRSLQHGQQPKYLNSPETDIFHKQFVFYGENLLKKPIKQLIICEGYTDVISITQAGIKGAVAPLGTSINDNQLRRALRYSGNVIVCLDGDQAGQRAAFKVAKIFLELINLEHRITFVVLPDAVDPAELVTKNPNQFKTMLQQALVLSEFCFNYVITNSKPINAEQTAHVEQELRAIAAIAKNTILAKNLKQYFKNQLYHWQRSRNLQPQNNSFKPTIKLP